MSAVNPLDWETQPSLVHPHEQIRAEGMAKTPLRHCPPTSWLLWPLPPPAEVGVRGHALPGVCTVVTVCFLVFRSVVPGFASGLDNHGLFQTRLRFLWQSICSKTCRLVMCLFPFSSVCQGSF